MKLTDMPTGKLQASLFKLGLALGEAGAEAFAKFDEDSAYTKRVAEFMLYGGNNQQALGHLAARAIMGDNMIGVEEVQRHLGVKLLENELRAIENIPYTAETLTAARKTHLLMLGYPILVTDVAREARFKVLYFKDEYEVSPPAFLTSSTSSAWFLVSKTVRDSVYEPTQGERLATVAEAVYMCVLKNHVSPRHYMLRNTIAVCNETSAGGETNVGYGITESYKFSVIKKPTLKPESTSRRGALTVILPNK